MRNRRRSKHDKQQALIGGHMDFDKILIVVNRLGRIIIETDPWVEAAGRYSIYKAKEVTLKKGVAAFDVVYLHNAVSRENLEELLPLIVDKTLAEFVCDVDKLRFDIHKVEGIGITNIYTERAFFLRYAISIQESASQYLRNQQPTCYTKPKIDLIKKIPATVASSGNKGSVKVILGGPGQGKTYYACHTAAEATRTHVYILICSSQWTSIHTDNISSIWKVIIHFFNLIGVPLGNLAGVEKDFIEITLKYNIFKIIFDGFDEFILWNKGRINPIYAIEMLSELAHATGSEITLTSRTTFWQSIFVLFDKRPMTTDVDSSLDFSPPLTLQSPIVLTAIQPFTQKNAIDYFNQRFSKKTWCVPLAQAAYASLIEHRIGDGDELLGRGFVLSMIADFIDSMPDAKSMPTDWTRTQNSTFGWIIDAFCRREQLRQKLKIDYVDQVNFIECFAIKSCLRSKCDDNVVLDCLIEAGVQDSFVSELMELDGNKKSPLHDHPIIHFNNITGTWHFSDPLIRINCIAMRLVRLFSDGSDDSELSVCLSSISNDLYIQYDDLALAIIEQISSNDSVESGIVIQRIIQRLQHITTSDFKPCKVKACRSLPTTIALLYTDRSERIGSLRRDRTAFFMSMFSDSVDCRNLYFTGTIISHNLSGIKFLNCEFYKVNWANCHFDSTTIFDNCVFSGGSTLKNFSIGQSKFIEPTYSDFDALYFIRCTQLSCNTIPLRTSYLEDDIRMFASLFVTQANKPDNVMSIVELNNSIVSNSPSYSSLLVSFQNHVLLDIGGGRYMIDPLHSEYINRLLQNNRPVGPFGKVLNDLITSLGLFR